MPDATDTWLTVMMTMTRLLIRMFVRWRASPETMPCLFLRARKFNLRTHGYEECVMIWAADERLAILQKVFARGGEAMLDH